MEEKTLFEGPLIEVRRATAVSSQMQYQRMNLLSQAGLQDCSLGGGPRGSIWRRRLCGGRVGEGGCLRHQRSHLVDSAALGLQPVLAPWDTIGFYWKGLHV